MTDDPNSKPEVVAWRLTALEQKVDSLHVKLDSYRETSAKSMCPQPGLCFGLKEACERLERVSSRHEKEIGDFKTEFAAAKGGARVLIGVAVILQALISFGLQFLFR